MGKPLFSCAVAIAATCANSLASASSEKVIYSFASESAAFGQVQEDSFGSLFGTTYSQHRVGTAYQLKQHRGHWRASTLHVFGSGSDGENPLAGLTPDRTEGTFYGTTTDGGAHGAGTVFSLVQSGQDWTESVLHDFQGSDGTDPSALMTRDKATGVLYGTAKQGGTFSCGAAFQLDPATKQLSVLHTFQGGADGCHPQVQMRQGSKAGTLIGATLGGGPRGDGTLFQLTEQGGDWTESLLYTFDGKSGALPLDISDPGDSAENSIYGVAESGGQHGSGVVFQLSKPHHKWVYNVIYAFTGGSDGAAPVGLRFDHQTGFIFGTTAGGGAFGRGVVFKLTNLGSSWSESVLHSFSGGSDGANPQSRPTIDPQTGVLYGTTINGGTHNGGVVYAVTP